MLLAGTGEGQSEGGGGMEESKAMVFSDSTNASDSEDTCRKFYSL